MMLIIIVLFLSMFVILVLFGKTCMQQKRIEELEYALLKKNEFMKAIREADKALEEADKVIDNDE